MRLGTLPIHIVKDQVGSKELRLDPKGQNKEEDLDLLKCMERLCSQQCLAKRGGSGSFEVHGETLQSTVSGKG